MPLLQHCSYPSETAKNWAPGWRCSSARACRILCSQSTGTGLTARQLTQRQHSQHCSSQKTTKKNGKSKKKVYSLSQKKHHQSTGGLGREWMWELEMYSICFRISRGDLRRTILCYSCNSHCTPKSGLQPENEKISDFSKKCKGSSVWSNFCGTTGPTTSRAEGTLAPLPRCRRRGLSPG